VLSNVSGQDAQIHKIERSRDEFLRPFDPRCYVPAAIGGKRVKYITGARAPPAGSQCGKFFIAAV